MHGSDSGNAPRSRQICGHHSAVGLPPDRIREPHARGNADLMPRATASGHLGAEIGCPAHPVILPGAIGVFGGRQVGGVLRFQRILSAGSCRRRPARPRSGAGRRLGPVLHLCHAKAFPDAPVRPKARKSRSRGRGAVKGPGPVDDAQCQAIIDPFWILKTTSDRTAPRWRATLWGRKPDRSRVTRRART